MAIIIFVALSLLLQGAALGEIICDDLPAGLCSFSIASSGKRCTLETGDRPGVRECKTSEVVVNTLSGHIETDDCIKACGLDRTVVGISSDFIFDQELISKICTKECHENCPNIIDLYTNLASAEGGSLQKMCKARESHLRRVMSELRSSGVARSVDLTVATPGPVPPLHFPAPGPVPPLDFPAPGPVPPLQSPAPGPFPNSPASPAATYIFLESS